MQRSSGLGASVRPEQAAELLARARLFGGLAPDALALLAQRAVVRRYRRGQLIFNEGDVAQSLFVIAQGSVKVFVTSAEGDNVILVTLQEGDVFGELSLIDEGRRSASAEVLADSVLLELGRDPFLESLRDNPQMAESVMRTLGEILRRLTEQTADLVFLDLHGRVAKLLVQLAEERGRPSDEGLELDLQLTQSDVASMVGGSRQSVNQVLKAFERRGYVTIAGRTIVVKQPDVLRRRASL